VEDDRFDHLTRRLGQSRTRRTVFSLLPGLLGGLLGAQLAPAPVAAACRRLNQECTKKRPRIGKWRKCCGGLVCRNKRCRIKECSAFLGCGEGRGCCNGTCVDLQTDETNCGQCGKACGGSPCLEGRCVGPCVDGLTACDGTCVDLLRDPEHCGSCHTVCQHQTTCQAGECSCRQRLESCESREQCCQDARRAPLADPTLFDDAVSCSERTGGLIPGIVACDDPPQGDYCCVNTGAACRTDCDCCGQLRCLEDGGCGLCLEAGRPCPSVCPLNGACDFCCTNECVEGYCRRRDSNPMCQPYGQPCHPDFPICCDNVPCSGGLCRFN